MKVHYDRRKFYFKNTIQDCNEIYRFIQANKKELIKENKNFETIYILSRKLYDKVKAKKDLNINEYIEYLYTIYPLAKKYKSKENYKFFLKFLVNSPVTIYIFYTYYKHLKEKILLPTLKNKFLFYVLNCIQDIKIKKFYNAIFDLRKFKHNGDL